MEAVFDALAVTVLLAGLTLALFVPFFFDEGLVLFLDGLVFFWLPAAAVVVLELLAGAAAFGAWAANIRGIEATAKAIVANKVVFIFSLPAGPSPAYSFILRPIARELDSLRRLSNPTNSGLSWLMFISLRK